MTVTSARKPSLPLVDTPRCDLRPTPGTALQPTKRRERFSCPGVKALRSHGALLEQVYYKEQGMSSVLASQAGCTPAGVQLSIPMPEGRGLSQHFGKAHLPLFTPRMKVVAYIQAFKTRLFS